MFRRILQSSVAIILLVASLSATPSFAVGLVVQRALDAGEGFSCAIRQTDLVYCVGKSESGQFGFTTSSTVITDPTAVPGLPAVQSVTLGAKFGCAIGQDGYGYCWGDDSQGQQGSATTGAQAKKIDLAKKLLDIQAGKEYACALTIDANVYCWGTLTNSGSYAYNSSTPAKVAGLSSISAIAVGDNDVCVLSQQVKCWGAITNSVEPVAIANSLGAVATVLGADFGCFVKSNLAYCFGDNSQGQLGRGSTAVSSDVLPVKDLDPVSTVFAGGQSACAITVFTTSFCWGNNDSKQVSVTNGDQLTRVPSAFGEAVGFAIGSNFVCALLHDSSHRCNGDNTFAQSGVLLVTEKPSASASNPMVKKVSAGATQTCAITENNRLMCWGNFLPDIDPSKEFRDVAVGNVSACAIDFVNKVLCWGANSNGQLGNNSNSTTLVPVEVQGLAYGAIAISAGYRHFCAISENNLVYCWGDNFKDQLGYSGADSKIANLVPGIASARSISLGDNHSCVLTTTYRGYCWGDNQRRQITSSGLSKLPLTEISSANIQELAAGGTNTCFIYSDIPDNGKLNCIGDNTELQAPGVLSGTYRDVSVGGSSVCATKTTDGKLVCFGSNVSLKLGRLGNKSATPTEVGILVNGIVAVGTSHVCFYRIMGLLQCWGSNASGQLASSFGYPKAFRTPSVTFAGKANVGETVQALLSGSGDANSSFQWYRYTGPNNSIAVSRAGFTSESIYLESPDLDRNVGVGVRLSKWGSVSEEFKFKMLVKVGKQLRILLSAKPVVTGTAKVGSRLSVSTGRWEIGVGLTFQWYRGTTPIAGEKDRTYLVTSKDIGKQLSVAVTGTKTGVPKLILKSAKTAKVTG